MSAAGGNVDFDGSLYGVTCTVTGQTGSPVNLTSSTVTFTINTTIQSATAALRPFPNSPREKGRQTPFYAFVLAVPGLILLGAGTSVLGRSGRQQGKVDRRKTLALVVVIGLLLLLPACGGGFKGQVIPVGTAQNYTLTAMGTVLDGSGNVMGVEIYTVSIAVAPQH